MSTAGSNGAIAGPLCGAPPHVGSNGRQDKKVIHRAACHLLELDFRIDDFVAQLVI